MKAIIIAGGKGTRLGKYTENLPKAMVNFNGKNLLERQIETLRFCGITDISIVTGYMADKIQIPNVKYYRVYDYENTNMVAGLFSAAEFELDGFDDVLLCYGDIIYEASVLRKILEAKIDVGVTVDLDYLDYWKARLDNWQDDMETLQINESGEIFELGAETKDTEKAKFRYVGLIRFSKKGVKELKKVFHEHKEKYWSSDKPWLNSKSFKKAYMTDMIQALINSGQKVHPIEIKRGWMEFDTSEDYEKAVKWSEDNEISKFINLDN